MIQDDLLKPFNVKLKLFLAFFLFFIVIYPALQLSAETLSLVKVTHKKERYSLIVRSGANLSFQSEKKTFFSDLFFKLPDHLLYFSVEHYLKRIYWPLENESTIANFSINARAPPVNT